MPTASSGVTFRDCWDGFDIGEHHKGSAEAYRTRCRWIWCESHDRCPPDHSGRRTIGFDPHLSGEPPPRSIPFSNFGFWIADFGLSARASVFMSTELPKAYDNKT